MSSWGKETGFISLYWKEHYIQYIYGLVQDWNNSIANALGLLQSCTKPLIYVEALLLHDYMLWFYRNLFLQIL